MAMNEGYKGYGDFQGTCVGCKRGGVWITLQTSPMKFIYQPHKYVVGFGTPSQALVDCQMSGQPAPNLGL